MATLVPLKSFDVGEIANQLHKALHGPDGVNEDGVIDLLLSQVNQQRQQVAQTYEDTFGENLHDGFNSQLAPGIAETCCFLVDRQPLYDAKELQTLLSPACQVEGAASECTMIEILCARSLDETMAARGAYEGDLGGSLIDDLQRDHRLLFETLLVSQASGQRQSSKDVDFELAKGEAKRLNEGGEGIWGDCNSGFFRLITVRSYNQLRNTFVEYETIAGRTIDDAITEFMAPELQEGCIGLATYCKDGLSYFADRLHNSLKGSCTDESTMRRVIIYRSEIDLMYIKGMFEQKYGESLSGFIDGNMQENYKKILLKMIGN